MNWHVGVSVKSCGSNQVWGKQSPKGKIGKSGERGRGTQRGCVGAGAVKGTTLSSKVVISSGGDLGGCSIIVSLEAYRGGTWYFEERQNNKKGRGGKKREIRVPIPYPTGMIGKPPQETDSNG